MVIAIKDFFPGLAAIARAKDAALNVGAIGMSQRRHKSHVCVFRIDHQRADMLAVFQADVRPALAAVNGFVHSIAVGDIAANAGLAGAHIDHVGIRFRHRNGPHRRDAFLVEHRYPVIAAIGALPHSAGHRAKIISAGIAGDAGHRQHAPAAERPHHPPFHAAVK